MTDADGTVSLSVGSNVITVEVTAEDGSTTRTYTVTVTREGRLCPKSLISPEKSAIHPKSLTLGRASEGCNVNESATSKMTCTRLGRSCESLLDAL